MHNDSAEGYGYSNSVDMQNIYLWHQCISLHDCSLCFRGVFFRDRLYIFHTRAAIVCAAIRKYVRNMTTDMFSGVALRAQTQFGSLPSSYTNLVQSG